MKFPRRLLAVLWTFAAALPVATVPGKGVEPSRPGVGATGDTSSESHATPGQARIALGEADLRDVRTPFLAPPRFHLDLITRVIVADAQTVRQSDGQTVRRSNPARAPPALH